MEEPTNDLEQKRRAERAHDLQPIGDLIERTAKTISEAAADGIPAAVTAELTVLGVPPATDPFLAGPMMMLSYAASRIKKIAGSMNSAICVLAQVTQVPVVAPWHLDLSGHDEIDIAVCNQARRIMEFAVEEIGEILGEALEGNDVTVLARRTHDLCEYMLLLWESVGSRLDG